MAYTDGEFSYSVKDANTHECQMTAGISVMKLTMPANVFAGSSIFVKAGEFFGVYCVGLPAVGSSDNVYMWRPYN